MKITMYSNYLNHHQLPLCVELRRKVGNNFIFVATSPTPNNRIQMGYSDMNNSYDFVLKEYENTTNKNKALKLAQESDVIIHGSAPEEYLNVRIANNKLSFKYSERLLKNGLYKILNPVRFIKNFLKFNKFRGKNIYLLTASAYAPLDYSLYFSFKNKMFKWGYFPEIKIQNIDKLVGNKNKSNIDLLWVGRFIDLKHPMDALKIALRLKEEGFEYNLTMVGTGELKTELKSFVRINELETFVNFTGPLTFEEVRKIMEESKIFLFTSDFGEGWGAVLNEAMNSACAVVASHAIGSVPYLLNSGHNGYIYENGNLEDLYKKVKLLLISENTRNKFSYNAYNSLINTWNAEIAASRLVKLSENLLVGELIEFKDGPISTAEIIGQKYEKGSMK